MKTVFCLAKREWLSIMGGASGLVVMGLYLTLAGYLFSVNVAVTQQATLRFAFQSFGLLTLLIVPLITMRLIAEEIQSGTFEILTTQPISDHEIVAGKLIAGWLVFATITAPTLLYLLVLVAFGSPDIMPALCAYLGQQLLGMMLLALGLAISTLTSSQVLAAMGTLFGGMLFWLAELAPRHLPGRLGDAVAYLSMFEHYGLFRRGVLDTRAIGFFVLTTGMFAYLAVRAVESRRWKFGVAPGSTPSRWTFPRGSMIMLIIAAVLVIDVIGMWVTRGRSSVMMWLELILAAAMIAVPAWLNRIRLRYELARRRAGLIFTVVLNCTLVVLIWGMGAFLTHRHFRRIDTTSSRRYALSEMTRDVLQQLETTVDMVLITSGQQAGDFRQEVDDLLAEYAARSRNVRIQRLDPVRQPGNVEQLTRRLNLPSLPSNEIIVAIDDQFRRIPLQAMVQQKRIRTAEQDLRWPPSFIGEAELTSAIIQLTRGQPGRVIFLSGHGEPSPEDSDARGVSFVAGELKRAGWAVDSQVITPGRPHFPEDTSVVVVAGPRRPMSDEVLTALGRLTDRGGGLLMLLEPATRTGLETFVANWDISLRDSIVVELRDHLASADPTSLHVSRFNPNHPIGKGMGNLAVVMPTARRVALTLVDPDPSIFNEPIMHTSGAGWAIMDPRREPLQIDRASDIRGPIALGVASERFRERAAPGEDPLLGRIVVIGDSDFISNQYADMAGNFDLFMNCIDWLSGRADLISIRPKVADVRLLSLTPVQMKRLFWFNVLLVPGLAIAVGIVAIVKRRQQA